MPGRESVLHTRLLAGSRICLLLILTAAISTTCRRPPPVAQDTNAPPQASVAKNSQEMALPIAGKPYPGTGVITIINHKEGWVEINHEAIEGLMPAMQMEWWVQDRSLLRNVRVGDKVNFVVVETGKGEFITELKRIE